MVSNRNKQVVQMNVDDVVFNGVLEVLSRRNVKNWTGTMTKLGQTLVKVVGRRNSHMLPGSPSALRVVLNRVVSRIRTRRIGVSFDRIGHFSTRIVKFSK
jgi:hypothetical protein